MVYITMSKERSRMLIAEHLTSATSQMSVF